MLQNKPSIDEIFFEALRLSTAGQRAMFLDAACADDPSRRRRVEQLLAAYPQANDFLESPAVAQPPADTCAATHETSGDASGTQIGPYKLLEQIGEGGMGVVYVAEQTQPVRRRVALKIIKPGMDTKQVVARFEAERQALAMMDHPNIARVLDAGTTEAGRPYFVMELVRGMPITDYCDKARLSPRQRLELLITVCQAVQHAHQKGIIHRDLKPSNVMVTMHDGRPMAKVIDFGVAKAIGQQLTDLTIYTAHTQLVGTPLYMSPEQAELSSHDVDTRSDVYSLGVLLYELLTGQTPFDKDTLSKAGFDEMRRIIREDEPPRPSHRVSTLGAPARSTVSQHRGIDQRELNRLLRGELDWIVMKALAKAPSERYESASAFAADVQRYLNDEPVQACPPSTGYRFRKFARRNVAALTTAALVSLALLLGTVMSTWQAIRAARAESQSKSNESRALAGEHKALAAAVAESAARQAETSERLRAEKGEQQAQHNFESAIEAVDRLLAHVGSDDLLDIPHAQPFRRKILQDALQFYEQFKSQSGNSSKVRHRLARTWTHMAYLMEELGDGKAAQAGHQASIETMEELLAETPNRIEYLETLGNAYMQSARQFTKELRDERGAAPQAAYQYSRCVEIFAQLSRAKAEPTESTPYSSGSFVNRQIRAMVELARVMETEERSRLALAALDLAEHAGDSAMPSRVYALLLNGELISATTPDQADQYFRQGLTLYRKWLAENKADESRHEQSSFGSLLALVARDSQFKVRHREEAVALYREAIDIKRKMVDSFPSNPGYRSSLAWYQSGLSNYLLFQARGKMAIENPHEAALLRGEAFSRFDEALAGTRRLVSDGHEFYRSQLAGILHSKASQLINVIDDFSKQNKSVAQLETMDVQRDEAQSLLTEAIQLCRQLAAEFPNDTTYSDRLAELLKLQAQHFGEKGTGQDALPNP